MEQPIAHEETEVESKHLLYVCSQPAEVSERIAIVWRVIATVAVLQTLALIAQVGGGLLLVIEAVHTRRNITKFQGALVDAESMREKQRAEIREGREKALKARNASSPLGVSVFDLLPQNNPARQFVDAAISATSPENTEPLVQDHGPAAGAERRALLTFLDSQFPSTPRRSHGPWPGVVLLFAGILLSYVANMLSTLVF